MLKTISVSLVLLAAASLSGCGGSSSNESAVTGTVTYRQRIALPPDAVVTVSIEDVSLADAPAEVIGKQVIETKGSQVPIPFDVPYDPGKIEANHTYSLRARIEDGNAKLLFINDTSVPVITRENPTEDVEVIVIPVGN
jgi:putative lipoprotein